MLKSLLPWFSVSMLAGSRPLWLVGLGLMGLHLALIAAVTGNLDQGVLSLLFWAAIATQVRQQGGYHLGRSPSVQRLGVVAIGLIGLAAWPLLSSDPAIARAVVRLLPLGAWAGWCLLGRRWRGQGPIWALVVAMSVPPRALPLLLETVLGGQICTTTAAIAAFGLHYLGFEVVQTGSLIQLPTGTVNVEFACTGAALLGLLLQVSILLAALTHWYLLPALGWWSAAIAALLSVVRVAIMAAVVGDETAFQFWHGPSGGQIFTLVALAVLSYRGLGRSGR
ncbi:archaeosortase/exosortase family protein [Nodosilinea sp. PGN35]|uniref:archaeosortase/exosortase family protein n=1 Tax=Nodosilinea sp. PGN35 TaxID=3020489 RepID=UPI0023B27A1E|nr:archaeosortase/exosortase family protein [Nodosilinea sp. TSF1-S3]MDF0369749.1 archaeosortase/exosortase family protein [Nodosilinea sp. TSF1-S3]